MLSERIARLTGVTGLDGSDTPTAYLLGMFPATAHVDLRRTGLFAWTVNWSWTNSLTKDSPLSTESVPIGSHWRLDRVALALSSVAAALLALLAVGPGPIFLLLAIVTGVTFWADPIMVTPSVQHLAHITAKVRAVFADTWTADASRKTDSWDQTTKVLRAMGETQLTYYEWRSQLRDLAANDSFRPQDWMARGEAVGEA